MDEDMPIVRLLPQAWTDQVRTSVIEDLVDNTGLMTVFSGDQMEIRSSEALRHQKHSGA